MVQPNLDQPSPSLYSHCSPLELGLHFTPAHKLLISNSTPSYMAAASLNLTNGAQLGHLPSERPLVASLRALNGRGRGPRQLCDGLPCAGAGGGDEDKSLRRARRWRARWCRASSRAAHARWRPAQGRWV